LEALGATVDIARYLAAAARALRTTGIEGVTVEPLFQSPRSNLQCAMTHSCFQRFKSRFSTASAQKILNLFDHAGLNDHGERRFFNRGVGAAGCPMQLRVADFFADLDKISCQVPEALVLGDLPLCLLYGAGGIILVTVLPSTSRVRE
jgi:hypothetical protein